MTEDVAPITVLARHAVRPGQTDVFHRWIRGIADASKQFDGYLGTELIRPVDAPESEYVSIFRFATKDNLESWMTSDARSEWLKRMSDFSDEPPEVNYHSLEFWFSPERYSGRAPKKYKMALVTFLVIWPLVHFVPAAVASSITAPALADEAISVALIVVLMTYAVMPIVTRVLGPLLGTKPT